jgi:hypothetical protein
MASSNYSHRLLLALAESLTREMRRYRVEWASTPLSDLLPSLLKLLNNHPRKLGDLVNRSHKDGPLEKLADGDLGAYEVPNIGYSYTTTQASAYARYLNQPIHVEAPDADKASPYSAKQIAQLDDVARAVVYAYLKLDPSQVTHHQTLENVAERLAPLYYLDFDLRGIGMDLVEYRDYLRDMPTADRPSFLRKYFSEYF